MNHKRRQVDKIYQRRRSQDTRRRIIGRPDQGCDQADRDEGDHMSRLSRVEKDSENHEESKILDRPKTFL